MNPKVTMVLRILFGVFCLFFGLNKFFGFLSFPPLPDTAQQLMDIYYGSGMLKIVGVLEIIGGLLLIIGKFVPLGLMILLPVMVNAFLFHLLHDMGNISGALIGLVFNLVVMFAYKSSFKGLFEA